MAMMALFNPGPSDATKASASTSRGKAKKMSVMRIRILSVQPPRNPAVEPTSRPMGAAITSARITM